MFPVGYSQRSTGRFGLFRRSHCLDEKFADNKSENAGVKLKESCVRMAINPQK